MHPQCRAVANGIRGGTWEAPVSVPLPQAEASSAEDEEQLTPICSAKDEEQLNLSCSAGDDRQLTQVPL